MSEFNDGLLYGLQVAVSVVHRMPGACDILFSDSRAMVAYKSIMDSARPTATRNGVRVIKEGKKPEAKVYRATCDHCLSEVEFNEHAPGVKFRNWGRVVIVSVTCPVCRTTITTEA